MFLLDFSDIPYTDWCGQTIHNHLDVHSSKFSGISGCSDAVSHGSASSTKSTELVLGKFENRILLEAIALEVFLSVMKE